VVYIDKSTIVYDLYPVGMKVCVWKGKELFEKNLKVGFKSGRTYISVFAYIAKKGCSQLFMVQK
jgi:hypothetical protein